MLGEHVLSAARHAVTGRIGLSVVDGGIETPPFGDAQRQVGVIGGRLTVSESSGRRDVEITTLRAAAEFAGVSAGAPRDVYAPSTTCDLDTPLLIDMAAFGLISGWYSLVDAALRDFLASATADGSVAITLWPEHFDVAIRLDDVNYGGLAGDELSTTPYAYVGPNARLLPTPRAGFWSAPFGAVCARDEVASVADLVAFFEAGRAAAAALRG
jgi:hypothetical protein